MASLRVGVVGCGQISDIYIQNLQSYGSTEVVACADLDIDRARAKALKWNIPRALSADDLISLDEVDLVLNLTVPKAHASVGVAALEAGKHVYNEKPLTISRNEARQMLDLASVKGLRVGCAPDTFLGAGLQTCREIIDSGHIGEPVATQAFMMCHGHESWHPAPEFYYETGGGPMLDMGPYYVTALVSLIGPIRRVTGSTRITFPTRTITSKPLSGKTVTVETSTHLAGLFDFESGAIGEITTTFDVWHAKLPWIAIYGTEGSMLVPDPNGFGGEILVRGSTDADWALHELTHGFAKNSRGLGVLDMAHAIHEGRPHRASGELAYHVLDVMHAVDESSHEGKHVKLASHVERPAPLPRDAFRQDIATS